MVRLGILVGGRCDFRYLYQRLEFVEFGLGDGGLEWCEGGRCRRGRGTEW